MIRTVVASLVLVCAISFTSAAHAGVYDSYIAKDRGQGWSEALLGTLDVPSSKLQVRASVYLFTNGHFVGVLWRGEKRGYRNGGLVFANTSERLIQGRWRTLANGQLSLSGYGTATNAAGGVQLRLSPSVAGANVARYAVALRMRRTSSTINAMRLALQRIGVRPLF